MIQVLGRKSLLQFLGSIVAWALSFVCVTIITNSMGMDDYGVLVRLISTLTLTFIVADLGLSLAHMKKISEGGDINDCVSTFLVIKVVLICLAVIVSMVGLFAWAVIFDGSVTKEYINIFVIILAYEVFLTLINVATYTFQGQMSVAKGFMIQAINPLARLPLLVILAINGGTITDLAWTYTIGIFLACALAFAILLRSRIKWRTPTLIRSYILLTIPLALMTAVNAIGTNIDKPLIGLAMSDTAAGSFSIAQMIISMISMVGVAVGTLTFPDFSGLYAGGKHEEMRKKSIVGEKYISLLTLPLILILLLFPGMILDIFSRGSGTDEANCLRLLGVGCYITMLNQVHYSQLLAANKARMMAKIALFSIILVVVLLPIMVFPEIAGVRMLGWGLTGAGFAWLLSNIVTVVMTRFEVRMITNTRMSWGILIHPLVGAAVVAAMLLIIIYWPLYGFIGLVVYSIITIALFIGAMFAARQIVKEDMVYFLDIINPKRMKSYITDELKKD